MSNEYHAQYNKLHAAQRAKTTKDSMNRCRYAITPEEFQSLLQKQGNYK